jgi:uncharacterized integral membrane protein
MADDQDPGEIRRASEIGKEEGGKLSPRAIAAIVLGLLVLIFALLNLEDASIDFGFSSVTMPLVFVIAVVGGVGFGVGILFSRHRERHRNA